MTKSIVTVGFHLATDVVSSVTFAANESLLDWDIVLFRPDISSFVYGGLLQETYRGKPSLNDDTSFRLREACEHWRRELKEAADAGKTVIVFLSDIVDVYIATGEKNISGSGRSRQTTRLVTTYSNYKSFPIAAEPTSRSGTAIKIVHKYRDFLASYWNAFGDYSKFRVTFPIDTRGACLVTKRDEIPVGLMLTQNSGGTLLLLPDLPVESTEFPDSDSDAETADENVESEMEAFETFSRKLVAQVVALDRTVHSSSNSTPEPPWTSQALFVLRGEAEVVQELLLVEKKFEEARRRKEKLLERRFEEASLRHLLFETGGALEKAVLKALILLRFSAQPFRGSDSEFDVIFHSSDGRLLGEVEGRDSRSVSIDKLRQLALNIHEDLSRDEIAEPAKGILFGNGHRLTDPSKRPEPFTEKCVKSAVLTSIGLVDTVDLFKVAQYLSCSDDELFARDCRMSLLSGVGVVAFPDIPKTLDVPIEKRTEVSC